MKIINILKSQFNKSNALKYIIPIYYFCFLLLNIFIYFVINFYDYDTEDKVIIKLQNSNNLGTMLYTLLAPILLAPIIEEFIYRFWLKDFRTKYTIQKIICIGFVMYYFERSIYYLIQFLDNSNPNFEIRYDPFFEYYEKFQIWLVVNHNQTWIFDVRYDFHRLIPIIIFIILYIFRNQLDKCNKNIKYKIFDIFDNNIFIFISAIIFSMMHWYQYDHSTSAAISIFLSGLYLGYARKYLSLKIAILMHATHNTIVTLIPIIFNYSTIQNANIYITFMTFYFFLVIFVYINESNRILNNIS